MRVSYAILLALLLPVAVAAQDSPKLSDEEAAYQQVCQLAAVTPNSEAFSRAWSDYVVEYVGPAGDLDAAIEQVIKGSNEFRRQFRAGFGGSGGPALPYFEMKKLMRGIAEEALGEAEP